MTSLLSKKNNYLCSLKKNLPFKMINRVLIRIRVVQIVFSCQQTEIKELKKAENDLIFSLQKSYDLYHYFLSLLVELTDMYENRVDTRKSKLLPSAEDANPNTKLLNNQFIAQLRDNKQLNKYLEDRPYSWHEHEAFVRSLLDAILLSDIYKEYLEKCDTDYKADSEFWHKIFKHIICQTPELDSLLEDESLFWNDDIEIVQSFVLKTIKKFDKETGEYQELLPMFKDDEDRVFAIRLLTETLLNANEYRDLIDKYTKNWDTERIAIMDMVIMQLAIAELLHFSSIPVNVTLNEYIDIAKSYSTEKSASFINGILDIIVKDLRESKRIIKK